MAAPAISGLAEAYAIMAVVLLDGRHFILETYAKI
jgi:hypothetical protein